MEKYEYQVVMAKIHEIEKEQLQWMDYVCNKVNYMVDVQKENVSERMLQLQGGEIKFDWLYKRKNLGICQSSPALLLYYY